MHGKERIAAILRECDQDNWDKQGSLAVTKEAGEALTKLVERLWIGPTLNGGLSVEMEHDDVGTISVEINAAGDIDNVWFSGPYRPKKPGSSTKDFRWFIEIDDKGNVDYSPKQQVI